MNEVFRMQTPTIDRNHLLYAGDWIVVTGIWLLAAYVDGLSPFQRVFSLEDAKISHPHTNQQIGGGTNNLISFVLPLVIMVVLPALSSSLIAVHHNALGLWTARATSRLITEFLKNQVGRLRPDFLARCAWDTSLKVCTGNIEDIVDGRKSFPSGHSSTAFAGMTFFFLWISAQTAAWNLSAPLQWSRFVLLNCRSLRLALSLVPLSFATWVALSRIEHYRHHKEDVIVGSTIGILCGSISYIIYWPNPLRSSSPDNRMLTEPLDTYNHAASTPESNYELASADDNGVQV